MNWIQPISFYLKQCAVCLQFNKHTLARIVLRFPSLFSWDILASFRHFTVRGSFKVIPKVICLSSGTWRFSPKAIKLAKPRGWRLSMDVPWASSSSDTRAGRAASNKWGKEPKERRNQSSQAWISRFTCEGTSERLPGIRKKVELGKVFCEWTRWESRLCCSTRVGAFFASMSVDGAVSYLLKESSPTQCVTH